MIQLADFAGGGVLCVLGILVALLERNISVSDPIKQKEKVLIVFCMVGSKGTTVQ